MINQRLLNAAIRTRAESLLVATTGSATLSATATGYERTTGSFADDGFLIGQEVSPVGFTETTPSVITAVSALTLAVDGGRIVQSAGAGRSLTVGLPAIRVYDNRTGAPSVLRLYVTNTLHQAAGGRTLLPTRRSRLVENWLSFWTVYGIAGVGDEAMLAYVDAIKALFMPGTVIDLHNGSNVFVPDDDSAAPKNSKILPVDGGWVRCMVTASLRGHTRNVVAA